MRSPLLLLNVAHFLDHYFLLIFPTAVLAIHPAWGMSYAEALALSTPAFIAFALATPLSGWLGDRFGRVTVMTLFFLGIGAASIATGFATGPMTLALGLTAIGLFASIYHPVGTAMVVAASEKTGRALGVNGVFGNMGVAAAAGLTALITAAFGWRMAFILPGLATLALGIVFHLQARAGSGARAAARSKPAIASSRRDQVRVLLVVVIASLLGGVTFNGITIALPKLFEERLQDLAGLTEIGVYASLVFAIAAFAQIPIGRLLDRVGARPVMVVMTGAQAALLLLIAGVDGPYTVLIAIPLMLAVFGEIPVTAWLVGNYVAEEWRSRAYSVQYLLALGVSSAVVPLVSVLHAQTGSQRALLLALSLAMALVFAAAWMLPAWRQGRLIRSAEAEAAQ